jgi:hypothetical protein
MPGRWICWREGLSVRPEKSRLKGIKSSVWKSGIEAGGHTQGKKEKKKDYEGI